MMQKSLFKKINYIALFLTLVTSFVTNAQEVRVIDNKGTIQQIRNNQVTVSNTAPTNPLEGDVWYDTNTNPITVKIWDEPSGQWEDIPQAGPSVYTGFFIIDNTTLTTTGTYSQTINVLPFEPSQIVFKAHPNIGSFNINEDNALPDTPNINSDNNTNRLDNTYGSMNGFARLDGTLISQAVIFIGGSGSSINNISRYSNNTQCIGIRYTNNNGNNLGIISAATTSFNSNGFSLDVTYTIGPAGAANGNLNQDLRDDVLDQSLIVMFTAYR